MSASNDNPGSGQDAEFLYFFPEDKVTKSDLQRILVEGSQEKRAWAISHLLRYAQWDDIWLYVSRDQVLELFSELDLPESLRGAWASWLKIETSVT